MVKTIDIKTTQNVTISYELAFPRERILAWLLDFIFMVAINLLLLLFFLLLQAFSQMGFDSDTWMIYNLLVPAPLVTFYTLIQESIFNGQTLGKMILRIKVVKLNGKQPTFIDYLMRWSLRFLDIWLSAGSLAVILVLSTDQAQRLGELISNTAVVRVQSKVAIGLSDIMKIDTRTSYVPEFPDIRNFREEDILVIKQTIERYQKYRNSAHISAIQELTKVMSEKLALASSPENKIVFLKTLIKDYIVLTR